VDAIKNVVECYKDWLNDMETEPNGLSAKLFNMNCKNNPFDLVEGVIPKTSFLGLSKNYDLFDKKLNDNNIEKKRTKRVFSRTFLSCY
jgi:hypothetical protein